MKLGTGQKTQIGIVATSAKVPHIELKLGVQKIRKEGLKVQVHPQCRKSHLYFAGTDLERAEAFFEYAQDDRFSVIWGARGGHGVIRLLPLLEKMAAKKGKPSKKLLVGYSDMTALMAFVRREWGWSTLHAPMPSLRKFSILDKSDWNAMVQWIQGESVSEIPWSNCKLNYWANPPTKAIQAPLVGGNLTVWNCVVGTPFESKADDSILFLEDVDESLYRIDRMLQQLLLSGNLNRVRAVVLGNFMHCRDHSPMVLKVAPTAQNRNRLLTSPQPEELKPLRKIMKESTALRQMFSEIGQHLKIPVASGLPVGHGPEVSPLPLGAEYRLTPHGELELLNWDWIRR